MFSPFTYTFCQCILNAFAGCLLHKEDTSVVILQVYIVLYLMKGDHCSMGNCFYIDSSVIVKNVIYRIVISNFFSISTLYLWLFLRQLKFFGSSVSMRNTFFVAKLI